MRRVKAASLSSLSLSRAAPLKEARIKAGDITAELALRPEHPVALLARLDQEIRTLAVETPAEAPSSWLARARALFQRPPEDQG